MKNKLIRVMIIEEEKRFVDLYEKTLNEEGFVPIIVNSKSILEEISSLKPDIIIVDVYGFDKCKMDVFRTVKDIYPNKPIIVISSLNSVYDCINSFELGAKNFIQKSVNTFPLIKTVKKVSFDTVNAI